MTIDEMLDSIRSLTRQALEFGVPELDLCLMVEDVCNDYAEDVHRALEEAAA